MAIIGGRAHNIKMIHEVGRLGYPYAEISLLDPEETASQVKELLKLKEQYGIYYLAHYPNENQPVDTKILQEKFVPKIKRLLDLSQELGINKATIHFWLDNRWAPAEVIAEKIKLLSEMVAYAVEKGVVLCLENLTERYDSFSVAFDAIDDLRMTLDIGHGELLSKENTAFNFIRYLFHKIEHVHVHDNHGGKGVEDDLHLALGQGKVDFPKIFSQLNDLGYDATITMEVKPVDMPCTKAEVEKYIES